MSDHRTPEALVTEQANDGGLWFVAETCPEAYLQQALRKLHAAVERRHVISGAFEKDAKDLLTKLYALFCCSGVTEKTELIRQALTDAYQLGIRAGSNS
jgi:hypothetical protein